MDELIENVQCELCGISVPDIDDGETRFYVPLNSHDYLTVVCPDCEDKLYACYNCGYYFDKETVKTTVCCDNKQVINYMGEQVKEVRNDR